MRQERIKPLLGLMASALLLCALCQLRCLASETEPTEVSGTLMTVQTETPARESPDTGAAAVEELAVGGPILVTGETGGWYQIFYQGKTLYVEAAAVSESSPVDVEALDQEIHDIEEKSQSWIASLITQQDGIRRSRIWRTVIIVLIVLIFAAGAVSALRQNGGTKEKEKGNGSKEAQEKQPRENYRYSDAVGTKREHDASKDKKDGI